MNTVCALLLVFALGFASAAPAVKVAAYAGTTDGTNTWTPPTTTPTCVAGTTADVKYETFPVTIASAGVYQVRCIYEDVWRTTGRALVYTGTFAAATPCQGFVHEAADSLGLQGGPRKNDGVYLTAGTYTVVVTGDSATSTGLFACNIMQSSINTNTTGSALKVNPVSNEQSDSCFSSSSNEVAAAAVTWTQETTGLYDINVYFSNTSYDATTLGSFGANAVIFKGDVIAMMNETVNDPCDTKFQAAYLIGGDLSGRFVVILQNVSLTAGANYTAVVSGGNAAALGYVGISVDPTIIRSNVDSPGTWTQPSRSVDPEECEDGYTNQPTYAYTFVAEYPTYIFDTQLTQWDSSSFDTFSFLYSGINNATVPQTCGGTGGVQLLYYGDTGDVRPLAFLGLNVGQYYTVIVSCYSSSPARGPFAVYAMTGSQIGVVPTGTATSTTGEPSSESSFLGVSLLLLVVAAIFTAF